MAGPYVRPTHRQREVLAALVALGTARAAADALGLTVHTVHSQLRKARVRSGMTTLQLVQRGTADGWLIASPHLGMGNRTDVR